MEIIQPKTGKRGFLIRGNNIINIEERHVGGNERGCMKIRLGFVGNSIRFFPKTKTKTGGGKLSSGRAT